jgi:hypothetical protein
MWILLVEPTHRHIVPVISTMIFSDKSLQIVGDISLGYASIILDMLEKDVNIH